MNITELTKLLEQQINSKMEEMTALGKEAKELSLKAETIYLKMALLWINELKPAENLIRSQNPELCELFDSLEKIYNEPKKEVVKKKEKNSCFCGNKDAKPEGHHSECPASRIESEFDLGMTISSFDKKD